MPATKKLALLNRRGTKLSRKKQLAAARAVKCRSIDGAEDLTSTPPRSSPEVVPSSVEESASKRKLGYFSRSPPTTAACLPTTVVNTDTLQSLFTNAQCKECGSTNIILKEQPSKRKGFVLFLRATCDDCSFVLGETYSSRRLNPQCFEVNRRMVASTLAIGVGHAGLEKMSELMGMPGMHVRTHQQHVTEFAKATNDTVRTVLEQSIAVVRDIYANKLFHCVGDGVLDIGVSYDGTWHKRGHTSNTGRGLVIETLTGLIIDFHVLSKYCQTCSTTGAQLKDLDPEAYRTWAEEHSKDCSRNFRDRLGLWRWRPPR